MGVKMANFSEDSRLKYYSHAQMENLLVLKQRSELIEATTVFTCYEDCNAVFVHTEIENISSEPIVLEEASAFVCGGLGENGIDSASDLYFTCFIQSHHGVF